MTYLSKEPNNINTQLSPYFTLVKILKTSCIIKSNFTAFSTNINKNIMIINGEYATYVNENSISFKINEINALFNVKIMKI